MKKTYILYLIAFVCSCSNQKDKESKDLSHESQKTSIDSTTQKDSIQAFNNDSLAGKWFQPHAAMVNITFKKDGSFEYNSFNVKSMQDEKLIGNYTISNNKIVMKATNMKDRQEIFDIKTNEGGYFIENEGCYMVKSSE